MGYTSFETTFRTGDFSDNRRRLLDWKMKIKQFSLGIVTSVLLVGVLVGQLNITIEEPVKSVFFSFIPFCYRIQSGTTILSRTEKRWFTSSRIRRTHVCRLFDYHLVISYLNGI